MKLSPVAAVVVILFLSALVALLFAFALDFSYVKTYAFVLGAWLGFNFFLPAKYRT
jgi:hypothetical protein